MVKAASAYTARADVWGLSYDIIEVFADFMDTGQCVYALHTRTAAMSLRTQLYRVRLMLEAKRKEGDDRAVELYDAAQYMYIEVRPTHEERSSKNDPHTLTISVAPITKIRYGDRLPWKEELA